MVGRQQGIASKSAPFLAAVVAAGAFAAAATGLAQPPAVPAPAAAPGPTGAGAPAAAPAEGAETPAGPRPLAAIEVVVDDEITVTGSRRPRNIAMVDREIESTVMSFYRMLNEVVVNEDFQVDCEWGTSEEKGIGETMIRRRFCYAGYQIEELRLKMEAQESAQAVADGEEDVEFVYTPDLAYLAKKEDEFAAVIIAAMQAYPDLMVAGEQLARLHIERAEMTGGEPALDRDARDRQVAREAVGRGPPR